MLRPGFFKSALAIALFSTLVFSFAAAQTHNGGPKYDKSQEAKIKGVVDEMRVLPEGGAVMVVKTGDNTLLVRLAPDEFLKEMEISFQKGDNVEIIGAKLADAPAPEMLAREVTANNNTVVLRDDAGKPVWVGWNPSKH
jgi:predicted PhzF superfamily epimerase YddE/YHI9